MATAIAVAKAPKNRDPKPVTSNFKDKEAVQQAMMAKLKESALTDDDAARLCLQPYTAQQVAQRLRNELTFHRAGFQIPYFDLDGRRVGFYRFRYLEYDNARGFAVLTHKNGSGPQKHDVRYVQPADTVPQLYLPPLLAAPWSAIAQRADVPLVITEGELKAACGCRHDIPTVGLGGVWSFRSAREVLHLLPVFKQFVWKDRTVYICYDSDAATNANVCGAENALAHELTNLGAKVYICRVPALGEKKTGMDDYIVSEGADAFKTQIMGTAESYAACDALFQLNAEVVYVRDPGVVLRLDTLQRMTAGAFVEHQYSDHIWYKPVTDVNGGTKLVEKSAPKEWLRWPSRARVERTTYRPGEERFTNTDELNLWPGWGCEPVRGSVQAWLDFIEFLFGKERAHYIHQWLAYPLQHAGTKLPTCLVCWGEAQGTGKSSVGYIMGRIYGRNYTEISDKHLQGNFNEWAENKQFIMGDEIASAHDKRRETADRMKSMITQPELRLNPKYIPSYTVPDCINYYFTSQHQDAFFVEDTDRRFIVNHVKDKAKPPEYYKKLWDWVKAGGDSAIFYYYLRLDLTGFDPQGHAPFSLDKQDMQDATRGESELWLAQLARDPDSMLRLDAVALPYKLWTVTDLRNLCASSGYDALSSVQFGRKLGRHFKQLCHGRAIDFVNYTSVKGRVVVGKPERLYAIRDVDAMLAIKSPIEAAKQYLSERGRALPKELTGKKPKY